MGTTLQSSRDSIDLYNPATAGQAGIKETDMTARWDRMIVDGKEVRCYVGVPDHARPRAGVVIAHHAFSMDESMCDTVHRLARAGYAAVLPDLFHRLPEGLAPLDKTGRLRDEELIIDMNAGLAHLKSLSPQVGPVGVMGFCMGGRVAYLMAGANPEFKAAAVFYGGRIDRALDGGSGKGLSPLQRSASIQAPVIGFFGADDATPSPQDVAAMDAELTRLDKWHEFHTYRDAGHAFMNFTNPERYRHRAAQSAWPQLIAFFDEFLVE